MGHSSGQCTNGQDAEEDDYEHSLSASCLSCKKHTDVDGRDRAANTLPDQPLEPDMTSYFLKIEYAIGQKTDFKSDMLHRSNGARRRLGGQKATFLCRLDGVLTDLCSSS